MVDNAIVIRTERVPKVLVTYCREDAPAAEACCETFRSWGCKALMDLTTIVPGRRWREQILANIRAADAVVVLLSRHILRKNRVFHWELQQVLEQAKRFDDSDVFVIPVRLEPCPIPPQLKDLHCFDWFRSNDLHELVPAIGDAWCRVSRPWLIARGDDDDGYCGGTPVARPPCPDTPGGPCTAKAASGEEELLRKR